MDIDYEKKNEFVSLKNNMNKIIQILVEPECFDFYLLPNESLIFFEECICDLDETSISVFPLMKEIAENEYLKFIINNELSDYHEQQNNLDRLREAYSLQSKGTPIEECLELLSSIQEHASKEVDHNESNVEEKRKSIFKKIMKLFD